MAKDGTNRGGRRVRAGDKPKSLAEKIAAGEDADIIEFTPTALEGADLDDVADLVGEDMPSPSEYLSARQKDGKPLGADARKSIFTNHSQNEVRINQTIKHNF